MESGWLPNELDNIDMPAEKLPAEVHSAAAINLNNAWRQAHLPEPNSKLLNVAI